MSKEYRIKGNPTRVLDLGIPGWSGSRDLLLLATVAQMMPSNGLIVEAGCYLGRSSYAIGRNLRDGCEFHCIDLWSTEHLHFSVDAQINQFHANRTKGNIRKMKRAANLAAKTKSWYPGWAKFTEECNSAIPFKMDIKDYTVDPCTSAVFIDADHSFDAVINDIRKFNINEEVLLLGDDFTYYWPDVTKAVGMIKEETGRILVSVPNSATWFLWPIKGYWADQLPEFLARAQRDLNP